MVKPRFRHPQVASDGNGGDCQRLRDLIHGEAAEIPEFNSLAFTRVELLKRSEATVQGYEVSAPLGLKAHRLFQCYFAYRALAGLPPAGVVHKDLPHQARSHSEEVRPSLPVWVFLINQPQVGLVYERGWLQRVTWGFLPQVAGGQLPELPVDQRREVLQGLLISLRPLGEQSGHFVRVSQGSHVDNAELPPFAPGLYTAFYSAGLPVLPAAFEKKTMPDDRFPPCFAHE